MIKQTRDLQRVLWRNGFDCFINRHQPRKKLVVSAFHKSLIIPLEF